MLFVRMCHEQDKSSIDLKAIALPQLIAEAVAAMQHNMTTVTIAFIDTRFLCSFCRCSIHELAMCFCICMCVATDREC